MHFKVFKNTVLLFVLASLSCGSQSETKTPNSENTIPIIVPEDRRLVPQNSIVGANKTEAYLPLLKGKNVALVTNQTSVIFKNKTSKNQNTYTHLVDSLLTLQISVIKVFSPEHGFRGHADAGEVVKDGTDHKTGLPLISLYGKNKKPSQVQLQGIDILIFDIQDVGARFYTYISTLHYVMEACAEANIPILILDRPNPNGHYIDGPILENAHKSYVGMHPVPVVHGMSIGEYAQMINGEGWLENGTLCELKIIPVDNYTHQTTYSLPIKPSPNLPNDVAINLYPSLCFFEGTNVSIGRGTNKQFQIVGSPFFNVKTHTFEFIPKPNEGAKYPKHEGKLCHGYDLSQHEKLNTLNLSWLIEFYNASKKYAPNEDFFTDFFTKLAGTKTLQQHIEAGWSENEIRAYWQEDLQHYNKMRAAYLLYE